MVYLISGKKNQGKTTKLRSLFENLDQASGFIAEKVYDCGRVSSYDLVNLNNGERRTAARLASLPVPETWDRTFKHGVFLFSEDAFIWAIGIFNEAVKAGAPAFFVDELGKAELKGLGHAALIHRAKDSGMDLYMTVRDVNVADAVKQFDFNDYRVIEVESRE